VSSLPSPVHVTNQGLLAKVCWPRFAGQGLLAKVCWLIERCFLRAVL
jgi:hypothetical protein